MDCHEWHFLLGSPFPCNTLPPPVRYLWTALSIVKNPTSSSVLWMLCKSALRALHLPIGSQIYLQDVPGIEYVRKKIHHWHFPLNYNRVVTTDFQRHLSLLSKNLYRTQFVKENALKTISLSLLLWPFPIFVKQSQTTLLHMSRSPFSDSCCRMVCFFKCQQTSLWDTN